VAINLSMLLYSGKLGSEQKLDRIIKLQYCISGNDFCNVFEIIILAYITVRLSFCLYVYCVYDLHNNNNMLSSCVCVLSHRVNISETVLDRYVVTTG